MVRGREQLAKIAGCVSAATLITASPASALGPPCPSLLVSDASSKRELSVGWPRPSKRGSIAAARSDDPLSPRCRGCDADIPRRGVAATPWPRRGNSAERSRGDAVAVTRKFRGQVRGSNADTADSAETSTRPAQVTFGKQSPLILGLPAKKVQPAAKPIFRGNKDPKPGLFKPAKPSVLYKNLA